jgi:hypothetical protein
LVRTTLPEGVDGRVNVNLITMRRGLKPDQELRTLVHELAHWLVHRDAPPGLHCTLFEYEAEAVERLVMARLGVPYPQPDLADFGCDSPTDGLVSASVTRVNWASNRICDALGLEPEQGASEAQAPVHLDAAAGKEVVLEYEHHRVGDLFGLAQAL